MPRPPTRDIWPLTDKRLSKDDPDFDFRLQKLLDLIEAHGPHGAAGGEPEELEVPPTLDGDAANYPGLEILTFTPPDTGLYELYASLRPSWPAPPSNGLWTEYRTEVDLYLTIDPVVELDADISTPRFRRFADQGADEAVINLTRDANAGIWYLNRWLKVRGAAREAMTLYMNVNSDKGDDLAAGAHQGVGSDITLSGFIWTRKVAD